MKNCAFQYAVYTGKIYENTDLITMEEALMLWDKYEDLFIKHLKSNNNPEMVIWIDMKNEDDYHTTLKHWDSNNIILHNERLYQLIK